MDAMKRSRSNTKSRSTAFAAKVDLLRKAFRWSVDMLRQRQANLLLPASIEAYVELDWLSWEGGSLKLTTVGENIYAQLRNEAAAGLASA